VGSASARETGFADGCKLFIMMQSHPSFTNDCFLFLDARIHCRSEQRTVHCE
jgi:hypothetical protein